MKDENEKDDGFCIKVYSPGNFIAKEITINGGVHLGTSQATGGFDDKQIAKALAACVGEGKAIDNKQKWAGGYWYLRWACNFPVDPQKFCPRIKELLPDLESKYQCDYRNIRELVTLSFMDQDPRQVDKVQYKKNDEKAFFLCREVALKIAEELGKAYLPKVDIGK